MYHPKLPFFCVAPMSELIHKNVTKAVTKMSSLFKTVAIKLNLSTIRNQQTKDNKS